MTDDDSDSGGDELWEMTNVDDVDPDVRDEHWNDEYRGGHDVDADEDTGYELHSNVCYDLVKYIRSNTIRNEEQFLLTTLGYLTGFFDETDHFVSGVIIGTSSSGKTHLQRKVEDLFRDEIMYQATTGSDKSFIYDGDWDKAWIASLDELNKPSQELIEFLKGVHGGDDGHTHKTTKGSVQEGFGTETTDRESKPYWLLYAQYDPDFELWNRLLKVPVHESTSKNKAVGAMAWDDHHIKVGEEDDTEYGFPFPDGTRALQSHIETIRQKVDSGEIPGYVKLPTDDLRDWHAYRDVTIPIFNHDRTEVNRIYEMIANLVRASALFNYHNREIAEIYDQEHGTRDAIIAEPQDVANVLSCRQTLVSTTHGLDDKRWAICRAIQNKGGELNEVEGISPIIEYLKTADAPLPPEDEMEHLLEDLQNNYLVERHPGAGDKGRDIYEFLGFDELGFANVPTNEHLFADTFDPISGRNFVDVHEELRAELESRGDDMMGNATSPDTSTSGGSSGGGSGGGSGSLSDFGGGRGPQVDLEPHQEAVRATMKRYIDGERIEDLTDVPVEGLIGITDPNDPDRNVDVDGTLLDPDDTVWSQPDKDDAWVTDVKAARREIRRAIQELTAERVVRYADIHEEADDGSPIDVTVDVLGREEI